MPVMKKCILILDNLRSVENVGSIFRSAESFGVSKIVLVGTTPAPRDRFNRVRQDMAKVSLGAEKLIDWEQAKSVSSEVSKLKGLGYQIVSLEQDRRSKRLRDFKPEEKFALIVGGEVNGVSKEILEASDEIVEIPMAGMKESLNVSVATGVALFHLLK